MNATKVLLTRPAQQSNDLAVSLTDSGAVPIVCPVIEIARLIDGEGLRNAWTQWRTKAERGLVALTSARTVEFLVDAGVKIDLPCAALVPRTKQAVQDAGWTVLADARDAAALAQDLIRTGYGGSDVWLPCSKKASTDFEDTLRGGGSSLMRVNVYDPRPTIERLLRIAQDERGFDVIVFHSSSAVDAVVEALGAERMAEVQVVCVGQSTGSRAGHRGLRVASVATQPTDQAVLAAIASIVATQSSIIGAT